jgi:hypothetical protein
VSVTSRDSVGPQCQLGETLELLVRPFEARFHIAHVQLNSGREEAGDHQGEHGEEGDEGDRRGEQAEDGQGF